VLDQHGVVDVIAEGVIDGVQLDLVAVGCELHAIRETASQVRDEFLGSLGATVANLTRGGLRKDRAGAGSQ